MTKRKKRLISSICAIAMLSGGAIAANAAIYGPTWTTLPAFRNPIKVISETHTGKYTYVDFLGTKDTLVIYAFTENILGATSGTVYIDLHGAGAITPPDTTHKDLNCWVGNDTVDWENAHVNIKVDL